LFKERKLAERKGIFVWKGNSGTFSGLNGLSMEEKPF
jgi:hypothetical protein